MWACLAAAGVGLGIGFRFRVTMLLAASLVTTSIVIAVAVYSGWSLSYTVGAIVLLLVIEHVSYLAGLLASSRR